MKQPVKKADPAKVAQSKTTETVKHQAPAKTPEINTTKPQPINRFLEATCDCV